MRFASLFAVVCSLAPLVACGNSGSGDDGADDVVDCTTAEYANHDEFVVGLNHTGDMGLLNFKLLSAAPAAPALGYNAWQVEITSAATVAPMSNATLDVYPYMPKHGHGAGVDVEVMAMPTAGDYNLDPINLHMPGLWEVTITADTDAGTDSAVFRPCIPN
ncbi:hypothetical protein BH11MYX2_BH11MYX2_06080 [soil metagenome]